MKKTIYVTVASLAAATFFIWMLLGLLSRDPSAAFKRHFGMRPPDTVREISRTGETGLASSSEYLVFVASPQDIERIIQKRKFEYVGSKPRESKYLNRERWEIEIRQAAEMGVTADRLYETGINGRVDYVLIINSDATKAYYHFEKW